LEVAGNLQLGVGHNDAAFTGIGGGGAVHRKTQLFDSSGVLLADDFDGLLGGNVLVLLSGRGLGGGSVLLGISLCSTVVFEALLYGVGGGGYGDRKR
jgi:hypothetical protein